MYFGETNPPALVSSGQSSATYDPGALNNSITYYWKITAHDNHSNSTEGVVWSFTTEALWLCGDAIIDARDSQSYTTVQIGTQCWMAENLNIGTMINGSGSQTDNATIEKYCYDNNTSNCDDYGGLYQWDEMMEYTTIEGTQGICPDGWYMPTDNEWDTLMNFLGGENVAGGEMKSTRTEPDAHPRWNSPNTGANNNSGFTAYPGGSRKYDATFPNNLGANSLWWSSSQNGSSHAWLRILEYSSAQVLTTYGDKSTGMSIRCLKSNYNPPNQAPDAPSNPNPGDAFIDQPINTTLSWICTDPENDPLTYDVYFDTNNPPAQVNTGQSTAVYDPGTLGNSTVYFWKIIAHDGQGNTTEGSVWSFTTGTFGEVFNPSTGETWMDRNLGASQVATSSTDAAAYGDYYQWGRATEGHENSSSSTTSTIASTPEPNLENSWDGSFITNPTYPSYWLSPQDNSLWQGVSGTNNPCPSGFRLPTNTEWEAERNSWASNDPTGAFGSPLKLPTAGFRFYNDGSISNEGSDGDYWSSSVSGVDAASLGFSNSYVLGICFNRRAFGLSVRCIKDGSYTYQTPPGPEINVWLWVRGDF